MPRPRPLVVCFAPILTLAVGLGGCTEEHAAAPQSRAVRVIQANPQETFASTEASGQIEARYVSNVGFLVSGRLISRNVDVGAVVKAGDLLAEVDATDFQNRRVAAQAQVSASRASLEQTSAQEARFRKLHAEGFTTQAQYDQALAALRQAQASLEGAEANLRLAQDELKYTHLVAPNEGVVTETGADPGQVVQAGQMVIELARLNEREAVFAVSSGQISSVGPGTAVKIWLQSEPDHVISGHVRELAPSADPKTGTYTVKVALPDAPARFRLGSLIVGRAQIAGGVLAQVPSSALLQTGERPQVWVVSMPQSVVERRPVIVARYDADAVTISRGLNKGDWVVIAGVNSLAEGQRVALEEVSQP